MVIVVDNLIRGVSPPLFRRPTFFNVKVSLPADDLVDGLWSVTLLEDILQVRTLPRPRRLYGLRISKRSHVLIPMRHGVSFGPRFSFSPFHCIPYRGSWPSYGALSSSSAAFGSRERARRRVLPNHGASAAGRTARRREGGVGGKGRAVSRVPAAAGGAALGCAQGPHGDRRPALRLRCENEVFYRALFPVCIAMVCTGILLLCRFWCTDAFCLASLSVLAVFLLFDMCVLVLFRLSGFNSTLLSLVCIVAG